jgi:hypothetical protein
MSRRLATFLAIVLVPLLAYPLLALAGGAPRFPTRAECVHEAVEGQPVDVVFGRLDDPVAAEELRDRVVSVGFTGTEALADGCGRWEVVLDNVPSLEIAEEIGREAETVNLQPTFEQAARG